MSASKKQQETVATASSSNAATSAAVQPAITSTAPVLATTAPVSLAATTAPVTSTVTTTTAPQTQHYYAHPGYAGYHPSTWTSHVQAHGRTTTSTPGVATQTTLGTPQHQAYYQATAAIPPPATSNPSTHSTAVNPAPSHTQSQSQSQAQSQLDTSDIATLNDALGSAGVDLRAEEENLRQPHGGSGGGSGGGKGAVLVGTGAGRGRGRKQGKKVVFDQTHLGARMRGVASKHGLGSGSPGVASSTMTGVSNGIADDSIVYLTLALRARLTTLIEAMIAAATHREETGFNLPAGLYPDGTPMWSQVIRRDVAKQLAVIEKVEREEELAARRERKARETYGSAGGVGTGAALGAGVLPSLDDALQMDTTEDEPKKKKKKPDGPGVTAKNMTEDVRKKLSNAVASQAAGLSTGKYAWMNAGATGTTIPKKPAVTATSSGGGNTSTTPAGATTSSWSRPFQSTKKKEEPAIEEDKRRAITLRDVVFIIERERGHGGGRGAARGWT
ncbi:hypothetical protein Clacol_000255 [Clathrus columnatus]|uniref:Transcription initiation factor TFIID subunit 4 n=1 Tax=Clathrus columnatus TaxID=1419009 RepID=A0AAV4ZY27_9AGAM|nr:hypothetical protein Clacol_000255 [Clathrus columnatus]